MIALYAVLVVVLAGLKGAIDGGKTIEAAILINAVVMCIGFIAVLQKRHK